MSGVVLIVDDDEANLVVCEAALGDEFDVITAPSASAALGELAQRDVAVLVTDQRMPGMTGVELCERARDESPDTIRILITAYSDLRAAIDAINRGQVRRYLRKPWEPEELMAEIRGALEVREMRGKLREAEKRLRRTEQIYTLGVVSAGLAHEIRNPLGWVTNNFDFVREVLAELHAGLERDGFDASRARARLMEVDEALSDLGEGVRRIGDIVKSMEPAARSGGGCDERVDLGEAVRLALRLMHHELRLRASLVVNANGGPVVMGSSTKLNQVVVNLLANAIQAFGDRPRDQNSVFVEVGRLEGDAYVDVADNGPGIPDEVAPRVFEAFYTTKGESGTGLGLSICRAIATEHGGQISHEPRPGGGTRFRLRIPLAPE